MKKYAVSYINFFDNILTTKIIEIDGDWKDALKQLFFQDYGNELFEGDELFKVDIEKAKEIAFDCDFLFDVVEII